MSPNRMSTTSTHPLNLQHSIPSSTFSTPSRLNSPSDSTNSLHSHSTLQRWNPCRLSPSPRLNPLILSWLIFLNRTHQRSCVHNVPTYILGLLLLLDLIRAGIGTRRFKEPRISPRTLCRLGRLGKRCSTRP